MHSNFMSEYNSDEIGYIKNMEEPKNNSKKLKGRKSVKNTNLNKPVKEVDNNVKSMFL